MPYSDDSLRPWLASMLHDKFAFWSGIQHVTDIGVGAGANYDAFKPVLPHSFWTGIEIWEPYIERFGLLEKYATVFVQDAREMDPLPPAHVTIFGDVLEHMPKSDAVALWNRARETSVYLIASLPIVHYPQGESEGNPHEEHVYHWSTEEVLHDLPGIVDYRVTPVIGAFWAEGQQ